MYPPKNPAGLKKVFDAILGQRDVDLLRRHCLVLSCPIRAHRKLTESFQIYYLVKDSDTHREGLYAETFLIPPQFCLYLDGLWALDHGLFSDALSCLADPSVVPDWASKIVKAFYSCGRALDALQFTNIVRPGLALDKDVVLRMELLLAKDLLEAYSFQVSFRVFLSCRSF